MRIIEGKKGKRGGKSLHRGNNNPIRKVPSPSTELGKSGGSNQERDINRFIEEGRMCSVQSIGKYNHKTKTNEKSRSET